MKYLVRLSDRFEYDEIHIASSSEYIPIWDAIIDEYSELENSASISKDQFTKAKFYYEWSQYTEERAMIQYLMIQTDHEYIKILRQRGYAINTNSTIDYWESLGRAAQRVHMHVTRLELLNKEIVRDINVSEAKDKNSFDIVMAWVSSNDIRIEDNVTVKRYLAIKKIITERMKAHDRAISQRKGMRVNGS